MSARTAMAVDPGLRVRQSGQPDRRAPFLFAYDISDPRRARLVRECLRRWRIEGQLSVHETLLLPFQAQELAVEVLEYLDPSTDRLLTCRLSQRAVPPVQKVTHPVVRSLVLGPWPPAPSFQSPSPAGWYLIAYDIADPRRLQRTQKQAAKACIFLQRSVYLYQGSSARLTDTLAAIRREIEPKLDDVRLYHFAGPGELWFLSGPSPPLAQLLDQGASVGGANRRLEQRLSTWVRTRS